MNEDTGSLDVRKREVGINGDRPVEIYFGGPSGGAGWVGPTSAEITITDDETPPVGTLSLGTPTFSRRKSIAR